MESLLFGIVFMERVFFFLGSGFFSQKWRVKEGTFYAEDELHGIEERIFPELIKLELDQL